MPSPDRLAALDWIKAAAIIAVLLTHGVPGFFDRPITPAELTALTLTGFHVPSFLFVAGFLSRAEAPVGLRRVSDRWQRILVPYFVVTAIIWLLGLVEFPTPRKFAFKIVTGAAFGHFYFVPVLAFCYLWLPVLSRLDGRALLGIVAAIACAAEIMWARPAWRLSENLYWQVRNPILQFHLGYFVLGIAAARYRGSIARIGRRERLLVTCAAAVGVAGFAWLAIANPDAASRPLGRLGYCVAVMAFLASAAPAGAAPAAVRFLSDATLTYYLYHWFAYLALMPMLSDSLPMLVRMLTLATAGLLLGTVVVVGGRRILGRHSRLLLGS